MTIATVHSEAIALTPSEQRSHYLAHLLQLAQQTPAADWLQPWRDRAAAQVQAQSFPTLRDEEWRFTDLSDLLNLSLSAPVDGSVEVTPEAIAPYLLPEAGHRLTFVNGVYAPHLSILPVAEGLIVGNLSSLSDAAIAQLQPYLAQQAGAEEVFTALNTAGLTDAAVVWVPKNQVVDQPIHLLFISTVGNTPTLHQPRGLVVAGPNSALTLVEDHVALGAGAYLTNPVTELWLAENAQVNHTRLQRDSMAAIHIGKTALSQARHSRYSGTVISSGAALSRHHLNLYQTGEQTETTLNGLTLITGTQVGDLHSVIALNHPHGTTRQLQKCIVGDRAHAVFNGKVFVPKAAQMTDAGQLNRTLLLSPKARVDTKPQLEIVADNVKCTHGATVSQLDADEVFYLQSRGIDAVSAQHLLVYAFAYEILQAIPVPSLQERLSAYVNQIFS